VLPGAFPYATWASMPRFLFVSAAIQLPTECTVVEIGVFEAIYTARALRNLKPDPVPEAVITRILDAAIRAPSAGTDAKKSTCS
jgi:Nitroreductase family